MSLSNRRMSGQQVTQGGKGEDFPLQCFHQSLDANRLPLEYVDRTIQGLTPAFVGDPVYTWLLHNYAPSEYEAKLAHLFSAFFTQAALNEAVFIEIADFSCCGVLIPPEKHIENPWTIPSAGLFSALWNVGLGPFKV